MSHLHFVNTLCMFICLSFSFHNISAQNLEGMIRIAAVGDSLLVSGMGTMVYEQTIDTESEWYNNMQQVFDQSRMTGASDLQLNRNGECEFAFEGDRYLVINRMLEDVFMEDIRVYNDGILKTLSTTAYRGFSQLGGIEYPTVQPGYITENADPRYYSSILGEPVAAFLGRDIEFVGESTIDDISCSLFRGTQYNTDDSVYVWLAPVSLYHRPMRIEQKTENNRTVYDINYIKTNGVISVTGIVRTHYSPSGSHTGTPHTTCTYTMRDDCRFNVDIPDELFELEFPPGALRESRMEPVYEVPVKEF